MDDPLVLVIFTEKEATATHIWKPVLTVGASGETLIKREHNKSVIRLLYGGYGVTTGMGRGRRRLYQKEDSGIYSKAVYE